MKRTRHKAYLNILLAFAVIALEMCARDPAPDVPIHIAEISSFVAHKDAYTGRDVCDLEQAPAVLFQEIDENFRQHWGRRQRRGCDGFSAAYPMLSVHFTRFQWYCANILRRRSTAAVYCRAAVIRYIHHQDGRPPADSLSA